MTTETNSEVGAALEHLREHQDRHLQELDEFLRIESVSADPAKAGEVERAAQWIMGELTTIGFEHVVAHPTTGHPIVTADWLHAGPEPVTVQAPGNPWAQRYELLLSTQYATGEPPTPTAILPGPVELPLRSVWMLRVHRRS